MIKVDKPASERMLISDDNLMLSREARADSIPGLEIASEMSGVHTVAQAAGVERASLFYAQTRGYTAARSGADDCAGFFQSIRIESNRQCA